MTADNELSELPELPDDGGGPLDPVIELSQLTQSNAERMNDMVRQGVSLTDTHTLFTSMIQNALLESILTHIQGEGAVTRTLLGVHQQLADLLTGAEKQVAQARLLAPGGMPAPEHNGRVTKPGRR